MNTAKQIELMHISVRLIVHPEQATPYNHNLFIDKLTSHLSRKWDVAKADFGYDNNGKKENPPEYKYIWDFCDHNPPNLRVFDALPIGIEVKLAIE